MYENPCSSNLHCSRANCFCVNQRTEINPCSYVIYILVQEADSRENKQEMYEEYWKVKCALEKNWRGLQFYIVSGKLSLRWWLSKNLKEGEEGATKSWEEPHARQKDPRAKKKKKTHMLSQGKGCGESAPRGRQSVRPGRLRCNKQGNGTGAGEGRRPCEAFWLLKRLWPLPRVRQGATGGCEQTRDPGWRSS